MADFKTHITTSTILGMAYGGAAVYQFGAPYPSGVLAAGLCGVAGMLPDLDSDSGVPLRESLALGAAVVPLLMLERFARLGWSPEMMVLGGALVYLLIRFGFGWALRRLTVHRGMFHSIPGALIAGQATALVCGSADVWFAYFMAGAVMLGYLSHLVLDELWSIEWSRGRWRFKSSHGTALKLWGRNPWTSAAAYAQVAILGYVLLNDPVWMQQLETHQAHLRHVAEQWSHHRLR